MPRPNQKNRFSIHTHPGDTSDEEDARNHVLRSFAEENSNAAKLVRKARKKRNAEVADWSSRVDQSSGGGSGVDTGKYGTSTQRLGAIASTKREDPHEADEAVETEFEGEEDSNISAHGTSDTHHRDGVSEEDVTDIEDDRSDDATQEAEAGGKRYSITDQDAESFYRTDALPSEGSSRLRARAGSSTALAKHRRGGVWDLRLTEGENS